MSDIGRPHPCPPEFITVTEANGRLSINLSNTEGRSLEHLLRHVRVLEPSYISILRQAINEALRGA
jgi:hypothetical protein